MASLATGESIFKYYPESWTPSKSDIGKRVRVKWKNDANEYDTYKGVIQNVSGKKIKILFNDGSNFYGNPNKRSDNPIQNGYIMIKEIKIMDPEKYSGFEKHAIGIELEKDTLGPEAFREKYGIKQRQVHLGKPLNKEVPIGNEHQAVIPQLQSNKKGGKKSIREETVSYFEEFPLYDIGADALSALEILGGGRRTKKKRKSRKKRGGFMAWMGLTKDFVKHNFDRLVDRGTKIKIKVPIWNLTGTGQRREEDVRDIILHKYEDENGNTINYINTDGNYFVYRYPDDTDDELEFENLANYNRGEIKINILKQQGGSGRKKRKKRKTKTRKRKRKTRRKR